MKAGFRAKPGKGDHKVPLILYFLLVNIFVRIGAAAIRKRREPKPAPVCATCSFAHVQYAFNGRRSISCTFGGGVRPITIDVVYCTDYRDRSAPERVPIVGFVHDVPESELTTEVATAGR